MQPTLTTSPRFPTLLSTLLASTTVCLALGCDTLDEPDLDDDIVTVAGPSDAVAPIANAPDAPLEGVELHEEDGMIIATGDDFRVRIHRSRRVAELNVSRDQLAHWYVEPFSRWSHEATRRLYQVFADDFDFIVFVPASEGQHPAILEDGESIRVSNNVSGLGLARHDHTGFWGSDGRLQSTIMLGGIKHIVSGPSLRELGERWANQYLPTNHWDHFGFSDVGGQLGGCAPDEIEYIGHGTYHCDFDGTTNWSPDGATHNDRPYARLELYLMGLMPAETVPPIQFMDDGVWIDPELGSFTGTLRDTNMDQLLSQHGKRLPTHDESQREFRTLFVVISGGELIDYPMFHSVDARVAEFAAPEAVVNTPGMFNFYEATSGLASLDAEDLDASIK